MAEEPEGVCFAGLLISRLRSRCPPASVLFPDGLRGSGTTRRVENIELEPRLWPKSMGGSEIESEKESRRRGDATGCEELTFLGSDDFETASKVWCLVGLRGPAGPVRVASWWCNEKRGTHIFQSETFEKGPSKDLGRTGWGKSRVKWQEERVETGKKTKVSAEGAAACRDSDDDSKTVLERK
ncbi:hypothetical protein IEO21_06923 [Rhodonia placenta]|uniref:Uncharacterized protein n=1 Tax=Rhodonia placenta TaxID=104341 RepID=A0A8H7NZF9_9APHY|nr:hypothetical protein IEO21_06923 [Postia placenta]